MTQVGIKLEILQAMVESAGIRTRHLQMLQRSEHSRKEKELLIDSGEETDDLELSSALPLNFKMSVLAQAWRKQELLPVT